MGFLLVLTIILAFPTDVIAQGRSSETSEEEAEKEGVEWSGNLDGRYFVFHTDKSSPLYQIQFADGLPQYLSLYGLEAYLNADYQTEDIGFRLKLHFLYYKDPELSLDQIVKLIDMMDTDIPFWPVDLLEAYGNINLSPNSSIQVGKRMYSWGKGYAFNPVGYVNPVKEPEEPERLHPGILSIDFETEESFDSSILKAIGLMAVIIPPIERVDGRYAELRNTDFALRTNLLLWDIDLDFMGYHSRIEPSSIGADLATNLGKGTEVYGELSYSSDKPKSTIVRNDLLITKENVYSYLLGIRYLSQWKTRIIAEYYHNGGGLTQSEYEDYVDFLQESIQSDNTGQALRYSQNYFSGVDLMRDYLYVSITLPELFGRFRFMPSVFSVYSLNDNSLLLALPLSFKPFTDIELMFWPTFLIGDEDTKFGSDQFEQKYEFRMRIDFGSSGHSSK